MNYLKVRRQLYSTDKVSYVDCNQIENLIVEVHLVNGEILTLEGLDAIELVMQAKPSMIEGKRFKFRKGAWIVHNIIAHPLMQIFALLRLYKLAIWIHEVTVPRPKGKHNG
jgi:hypothetical protein